jgi:hypothetical protein
MNIGLKKSACAVSSVLGKGLHTDMDMDKKFVMCARSAAYSVMDLHLNTMYHAEKKRGRGVASARGEGRGWGLAASIGLLMEIYMFCVLERE